MSKYEHPAIGLYKTFSALGSGHTELLEASQSKKRVTIYSIYAELCFTDYWVY